MTSEDDGFDLDATTDRETDDRYYDEDRDSRMPLLATATNGNRSKYMASQQQWQLSNSRRQSDNSQRYSNTENQIAMTTQLLQRKPITRTNTTAAPWTNDASRALLNFSDYDRALVPLQQHTHRNARTGAGAGEQLVAERQRVDMAQINPDFLPQAKTGAGAGESVGDGYSGSGVSKAKLTVCAIVAFVAFLVVLILLIVIWDQTKDNGDAIDHIQVVTVFDGHFNSHCPPCVCNITCDSMGFSSSSSSSSSTGSGG